MTAGTARQIYVNLPVKDVGRSVEFFTQLGFDFDPQFTDENATCMILSDHAFVMLLAEDFFRTFTKKPVTDAAIGTEVILALSASSREEVDDLVGRALAAGGKPSNEPMDHGFMYASSFQDVDGHLWEVVYMETDAPPE
jgi:predicted lactoylglutathione lyase